MGQPIQDPLVITPPKRLSERPIFVSPNVLSTFRLMHDPFDPNKEDKWFDGKVAPIHDSNEAKFLIRGSETYKDMLADITAATTVKPSPDDRPFVYYLGWILDLGDIPNKSGGNFTMVPGKPETQPGLVLADAASKGVEVRAMLWSQRQFRFSPLGMQGQGDFLNKQTGARCIVDDKTGELLESPGLIPGGKLIQRLGAHHQKILVVNGATGLVAYCGGLDINRDRVDKDSGNDGLSLQDVHVRIQGPSSFDFLLLFRQRWDDYLHGQDSANDHDDVKPKVSDAELFRRNLLSPFPTRRPGPVDQLPHRQRIQVARTYHSGLYDRIAPPDGSFDPVHPNGPPPGEKGIRKMIFHGIRTAERFIYIEDQYLVNMDVSKELEKAIAKTGFRQLIILISSDGNLGHDFFGQQALRHRNFLLPLVEGPNKSKVHVFNRINRGVHSKVYIFDDKYAIVGSANCNQRGLSHDSEVDAGIFDRSSDVEPAFHFARRLRMRLWATHLNLKGPAFDDKNPATDPNVPKNDDDEFSELADGVASVVHWLKRPPNARISPYTPKSDKDAQQQAVDGLKQALLEFETLKNLPGFAQSALEPGLTTLVKKFLQNQDLFWFNLIDPSDG